MNLNGKWADQGIKKVGFILLPPDITKYDLMKLVAQMARNAFKNPYMVELIENLDLTKYPKIMHSRPGEML